MNGDKIVKWDIYMVDLGSIKDAGVQAKVRPCLVVNSFGLTCTVIPLSSKTSHKHMRSHVELGEECGLIKPSQLLAEQITTVAKIRVGRRVGEIEDMEIKKRVKEGRWEAEGSMWVEADTNVASGEALVRQFLVGKRFFRDEFGVDNKIMWLPDVFGYSAAIPQILKKCGF